MALEINKRNIIKRTDRLKQFLKQFYMFLVELQTSTFILEESVKQKIPSIYERPIKKS
jgi:hypothetical protein